MKRRHSDSGALSIILAVSMVFLFGLAAMAVDVGFMQTRRGGLQAAADAAALAGARGGLSTARVTAMATANGYTTGGGVTVLATPDTTNNRMRVDITVPQPRFFAAGLGFAARNITVSAIAGAVPINPAILALGTACGSGMGGGVDIQSPSLTIAGNVAANAGVVFGSSTTVTGDVVYGPCPSSQGTATVGSFGPGGGAFTDPLATIGLGSFTCANGTSLLSGDISFGLTSASSGVYCSGGRLDLNWSSNINITATFVAKGPITFSGTTGTITAAANGLVGYSTSTATCPSNQAINIGNDTVTFNGSFYAPLGCLNFSGNQMVINGSLIGGRVQIQAGNTSAVNGPGGSSPGGSFLFQ